MSDSGVGVEPQVDQYHRTHRIGEEQGGTFCSTCRKRDERLSKATSALRQIRSIGATSGTNVNAWNDAFDVLDALILDAVLRVSDV